eukprot:3797669-Alexandrium_andersonii.AAC.1
MGLIRPRVVPTFQYWHASPSNVEGDVLRWFCHSPQRLPHPEDTCGPVAQRSCVVRRPTTAAAWARASGATRTPCPTISWCLGRRAEVVPGPFSGPDYECNNISGTAQNAAENCRM